MTGMEELRTEEGDLWAVDALSETRRVYASRMPLTDSVRLLLVNTSGTSSDYLVPDERVGLAKLLLTGLTRDQILAALPPNLLTEEVETEYERLPEHAQLVTVIDTYMQASPERRRQVSLTTWLGILADPSQGWQPPSKLRTEWALRKDGTEDEIVSGPVGSRDVVDYAERALRPDLKVHVVRRDVTDWVEG